MRYYLFISENGHLIPTGDFRGYETKSEAVRVAKKKVDDALPNTTIRVMREVGHAYLAGNGSREYKDAEA